MTSDEQIGRNVAAARGDMSQKELARQMRDAGFKWSQATVWSVEKGERPLRLAEAEALGAILVRPLDVFTARDGEEVVYALTRRVNESHRAVIDAMNNYDEARAQLAMALDRIPNYEKSGLLFVATDWIEQTLDTVLEDYKTGLKADAAAERTRSEMTVEEWFSEGKSQGKWLDAYNRAWLSFINGVKPDGKHQAEA